MGKELSNENIKLLVAEANKQLLNSVNNIFIGIVGCDSECASELLSNSRNNIGKENGRNRLSLKRWCSEKNYNHRCVYDILCDTEVGLGWVERIKKSNSFKMTARGINEIYGSYKITQFPIMTIVEGSVYVDETHENFESFINEIIKHPLFEQCGGYNERLKSRRLIFSKNELALAKDLGIELGVEGITDGS